MSNELKTPSFEMMRRNALKAEALLKEMANAHRLMVLCTLVASEKTAGDLAKTIDLSQSALSQHLARLREAGLVESEKRGQQVMYRISSMEAQALLSLLYVMFCKS